MTHHAVEDLAIMRALPNMTVIAPGDPVEAAMATKAIIEYPGPCYLRLGKANEPIVHKEKPVFQIGKSITVRKGNDVTLISTGGMLLNSMLAAQELAEQGIEARVLSMHTIKPLDKEAVLLASLETKLITTIEEHSLTGGLGSAVAEVLSESSNLPDKFKRIGIENSFSSQIGSHEYLRKIYGLTPGSISKTIKTMIA